ncbi:hypothetical protein PV458_31080 [Streptomyces sp. MN03-5084-2B]|nr:hypothetical protein [Streptomyces sp. MN03-5084-2B]
MERRHNRQAGPLRAPRLIATVVAASLVVAGVSLFIAALAARALFGERGGVVGGTVVFAVTVVLSAGAGSAVASLIKRRLDH